MNIAIDCRYIGKSGIGRVCQGILDNLDYKKHKFYLIGKSEYLGKYKDAIIIANDSEPYSKSGLLKFPKSINKDCDALIIPNFLIPYGVKIPVHTIIHDLAFLDVKETRRGFIDYKIKKYLLKRCIKKSKTISCVSKFTVDRCRHYYGKLADKCYQNYIGISLDIHHKYGDIKKEPKSLVCVGNVKPHKGIKTLIDAYKLLKDKGYKLSIIGEMEGFLTGLDLSKENVEGIEFLGKLNDKELTDKVSKAEFLIQPSKYEGFGLTPMEALYVGTRPIISDIPVFKEIYSDTPAIFFKVGNEKSLYEAILNAEPSFDFDYESSKAKYNYKLTAERMLEKVCE